MLEETKPTFDMELIVSLPKNMPKVEHNLDKLEEYAKNINEHYSKLIIQKEHIKDAEAEKAKINNLIKDVKRLRIDKLKEYKQPIEDFEETAKRVEFILLEASENIKASLDIFEGDRKEEKYEKVIKPLINNIISQEFVNGNFINPDDIEENPKWYNKTYKDEDIEKDIQLQVYAIVMGNKTITFKGTEEQVNKLRAYAKELGMEEIEYGNSKN